MSTLEQQIEAAFDYRGNVTLTLHAGETLEGFLFNRDFAPHASLKEPPFVELFLASGERRKLRLDEVAAVELTGKDHAAV
jgi:transcriptional antiterminator Rof (Rho-off)